MAGNVKDIDRQYYRVDNADLDNCIFHIFEDKYSHNQPLAKEEGHSSYDASDR